MINRKENAAGKASFYSTCAASVFWGKGSTMSESKNLKETIIEAAWDLFYEKGYEQTTINDIISKAGVAKGSFYYYLFPQQGHSTWYAFQHAR